MPLNNHPSAKPTYDFYDTVPLGKTAIGNGELVSQLVNLPDTNFRGGSMTWHWHSPEGVASYLVENSIGSYDLSVRLSSSGIQYYEAQDLAIPKNRAAANKAIMDMQEDVLNFQTAFNGTYPFTTDGVVIGVPNAGFEEEMQTKITFANESIDLDTLHHENMHQWWGDNVSEANYNLTFFKEGLATLGEFLFSAAQAAAGGSSAAFEQTLVDIFNQFYAGSDLLWTARPPIRVRTPSSRDRRRTSARASRTSRSAAYSGRRTSTPRCSSFNARTGRAALPRRSSSRRSNRSCRRRVPRASRR
jgi:aminopeptidase N